jgi:pimeloyl-ACP methyl ester carboxylesterase
MELAAIDDIEVEYELRGSGEPVVLIHWGVSARWAEPLLAEPVLAEHYRLLWYHRAGFGGSSRVEGPISMADHAEHCRLLLRRLGIERAHVVGHSSSALIALQLALDAPDVVQSLALMDAARPAPATESQAAFVREVAGAAISRYHEGDVAAAVDLWARGVFGPGYRVPLDRVCRASGDRHLRGHVLRPGAACCSAVVVRRDQCAPDRPARACRRRREQRSYIS